MHTAPDDEAEGSIAQGPGPKSLLDDIDWNVLGARVGGAALQLGRYKLCCFLNNKAIKNRETLRVEDVYNVATVAHF